MSSSYVPPTSVSRDGHTFWQIKEMIQFCDSIATKIPGMAHLRENKVNLEEMVKSIKDYINRTEVEIIEGHGWRVNLWNSELNTVWSQSSKSYTTPSTFKFGAPTHPYKGNPGSQSSKSNTTPTFKFGAPIHPYRENPLCKFIEHTEKGERWECLHFYDLFFGSSEEKKEKLKKELVEMYEATQLTGDAPGTKEKKYKAKRDLKKKLLSLVDEFFYIFFIGVDKYKDIEGNKLTPLTSCNTQYLSRLIWAFDKTGYAGIENIPAELWELVKEHMSLKDTLAAAQVSKRWKNVMNTNKLHTHVCTEAIERNPIDSEIFKYMCGTLEKPRGNGLTKCINPEEVYKACEKKYSIATGEVPNEDPEELD